MRIVVLDLETTGLTVGHHDIVEMGVAALDVATDADGRPLDLAIGEPRALVVEPRHLDRADPRALEVNRYHERLAPVVEAGGAVDLRSALRSLNDYVGPSGMIAGASVHRFDWPMLQAAYRACELEPAWVYHRHLDVYSYAAGWLGLVESPRLGELRTRLELPPIPEKARHTAAGDALATAEVLAALLRI